MKLLKGKKTYVLALIALVYALSAYFTGHIGQQQMLQEIWAALVAAGLRAGMSNS